MLRNDELDLLTRMLYWLADGTPWRNIIGGTEKDITGERREQPSRFLL